MKINQLDFSQLKVNFNNPQKRKKVLCIMLASLIVSLCLILATGYEYSTWQTTNGIITEATQTQKSSGKWLHSIHYSYMVDGARYADNLYTSGKLSDTEYVGRIVKIWYNPQRPSQSSYSEPEESNLFTLSPFFIALFICLRILGVRKKLVYFGL